MGTWDTSISGNDTFANIYSNFFNLYNQGRHPVYASAQVMKMFEDEFIDTDTRNNALFALALAQWETKYQDDQVFKEVEKIIVTEIDVQIWEELGANTVMLEERKEILREFLKKITQPKDKPKRRVKEKFDFKIINLIKIQAPDNLKNFEVNEEYVNGKYIHTSSNMQWKDGGGSILYFTGQGKKIFAGWIDSNTLEVVHDKDIVFTKKDDSAYYLGDKVTVRYIAQ